ncbi:hypothetical protein ABIE24_003202 [Mycetocola sp. 2940]
MGPDGAPRPPIGPQWLLPLSTGPQRRFSARASNPFGPLGHGGALESPQTAVAHLESPQFAARGCHGERFVAIRQLRGHRRGPAPVDRTQMAVAAIDWAATAVQRTSEQPFPPTQPRPRARVATNCGCPPRVPTTCCPRIPRRTFRGDSGALRTTRRAEKRNRAQCAWRSGPHGCSRDRLSRNGGSAHERATLSAHSATAAPFRTAGSAAPQARGGDPTRTPRGPVSRRSRSRSSPPRRHRPPAAARCPRS